MLTRFGASRLLLTAWLVLAAGTGGVHAQSDAGGGPGIEPTRIVVVDFQAVVRRSAAAQQIQTQIDEFRTAYQNEFGAIEEDLREAETALTAERGAVPEEQFLERRRDFERRVTEAQREAQLRRAALDQALDRAMDSVRGTLLEVIAEIAQEREIAIVLSKQQVILADRALDLTDECLARLNAALPHAEVRLGE